MEDTGNVLIILVVEDEKLIRELVVELLEQTGNIKCIQAESAEEALYFYKRGEIDVVLTDNDLSHSGCVENKPPMNGLELTCKILEINPEAVVIMSSGDGVKEHALTAGAKAFFAKPFQLCDLMDVIREIT